MATDRIEVQRPEYPQPIVVERHPHGGIRLRGRFDTFWIKEEETFRKVAFAILEMTDPPDLKATFEQEGDL